MSAIIRQIASPKSKFLFHRTCISLPSLEYPPLFSFILIHVWLNENSCIVFVEYVADVFNKEWKTKRRNIYIKKKSISEYWVVNSRSHQGSWDFGSKATVGYFVWLLLEARGISWVLNITLNCERWWDHQQQEQL